MKRAVEILVDLFSLEVKLGRIGNDFEFRIYAGWALYAVAAGYVAWKALS